MAGWIKLLVFITLHLTTTGANQNDCMTVVQDLTSLFGQGNISSPSLDEYVGETNQSCIDRCCQSESCNIVQFRFSNSSESPNCVLYSCHPTTSCYLATADNIQFFIRQQSPGSNTPNPSGDTDDTLSAPSGDVSTLTSPRATPFSPEPQEPASNTTHDSSVKTSPPTPISSDPHDIGADNSNMKSSETLSPTKQSQDALASTVMPPNTPATSMPASSIPETRLSLPNTDVPGSPSTDSPSLTSTNSTSLPVTESPTFQSNDSFGVSSTNSPNVQTTDLSSLSSTVSANVPSTYMPSLSSTYSTHLESTDLSSVQSNDSSNISFPDTSDINILSTSSPDNDTTSANVQSSINPTLTTEDTTTNTASSDDPGASFLISDPSVFITSSSQVNIEETIQSSIASLEPLSSLNQESNSHAPYITESHTFSSTMTSQDATAVLKDHTSLMDGNETSGNGDQIQGSGDRDNRPQELSLTITPTATSEYATSEVQSAEEIFRNATSSTNGLLPQGTSEAMMALLVCSLTFGCVFLLTVVAVLGKRIYDGYQKRHYSRLDYLINGMYN